MVDFQDKSLNFMLKIKDSENIIIVDYYHTNLTENEINESNKESNYSLVEEEIISTIIPKAVKLPNYLWIVMTKPKQEISNKIVSDIKSKSNIILFNKLNDFNIFLGFLLGMISVINNSTQSTKSILYFCGEVNSNLLAYKNLFTINNNLEIINDEIENKKVDELALNDKIYSKKRVIINIYRNDFFKVNLESIILEQEKITNKNKLSKLFEANQIGNTDNKEENIQINSNLKNVMTEKLSKKELKQVVKKKNNNQNTFMENKNHSKDLILEITNSYNYNMLLIKIEKSLENNCPNKYIDLKRSLVNSAQQNNQQFHFKNCTLEDETLAFLLFTSLLKKQTIQNDLLLKIIEGNYIISFKDLEVLFTFEINGILIDDISKLVSGIMPNTNNNVNKIKPNIEKKNEGNNNSKNKIIGEYVNHYTFLVKNNSFFCNFIKNSIKKLLFSFDLNNINLLPNNIKGLKNRIENFIKTCQDFKIIDKNLRAGMLENNILNIVPDSINTQDTNNELDLTSIQSTDKLMILIIEGIIIEFINLKLILVDDKGKLTYDMKKIEAKKIIFK